MGTAQSSSFCLDWGYLILTNITEIRNWAVWQMLVFTSPDFSRILLCHNYRGQVVRWEFLILLKKKKVFVLNHVKFETMTQGCLQTRNAEGEGTVLVTVYFFWILFGEWWGQASICWLSGLPVMLEAACLLPWVCTFSLLHPNVPFIHKTSSGLKCTFIQDSKFQGRTAYVEEQWRVSLILFSTRIGQ